MKKCKSCKRPFNARNSLQQVCSPQCALAMVKQQKVKEFKAETRKRKQALKGKAEYMKEAQAAFNAFVRIRDHNLPCISCQRHHQGQYHAGHYRTTKAASQLRFNLFNVHKQCSVCNNHLSGAITEYRINLCKKIGVERVEWIEHNQDEARYSIEYLKRLRAIFAKRKRIYEKIRKTEVNL